MIESLKRNYDRIVLFGAALCALLFGAFLASEATALSSRFDRAAVEPRAEIGGDLSASPLAALEHVAGEQEWLTPAAPRQPAKGLPLLRSTLQIVKDGKLYDLLDPRTRTLRSPLSNRYLLEHNLPALRSDVASLDLDGDGFTNAEEFLGGETDPRDPGDHPPYTSKLRLAGFEVDRFSLTFLGGDETELRVRETQLEAGHAEAKKANHFTAVGESFGEIFPKRWQVIAYHEKRELNPRTGAMHDASELVVKDGRRPGSPPLRLKLEQPHPMPTYHAVFEFHLPGYEGELAARPGVGEIFQLPCEPGVRYRLTELSGRLGDGAVISRLGVEPTVTIPIPPEETE